MKKIKNIAIIAHVDHGKTTLVDAILKQSGTFTEHEEVAERVMDSDDLEKERGITIFSKNAAVNYKDYKINLVDTPGHADFGGEVQRILKMVDSVLLVVDAFEGVMPQTKYVLKKSLELGLDPIVIINKIDRPNSRPDEVVDELFDLFVDLDANDSQLDFPVVYASALNGVATKDINEENDNILPVLDTIIENVKEPEGDPEKPFQFLVTNVEYSNYLGKMGLGKIHNGEVNLGDKVLLLKKDGERLEYRISKIYSYSGLEKVEVNHATAGDIVTIAGLEKIDVGETVADEANPKPLPSIDIDKPTVGMTFKVNDSPFAGQEGEYVTSRKIWDRLQDELKTNVSLVVEETDSADAFVVKGRGELQLGILIENMRREGYELQVSKPEVLLKEVDGKKMEPIELAIVDVDSEFVGTIIERFGARKGEMLNMEQGSDGYTRLEFKIPARGLIGFSNEFMTITKGTGTLNHSFYEYEYYKGEIPTRMNGSLVALEKGEATAYSLNNFQDRGSMFIKPGVKVYQGMVIGANNRENDLVLNVCKGKKLTNVRSAAADDAVNLAPPIEMSLEQSLEYISDDELVEITPESIRLRKKILDPKMRKRAGRKK
ncbi:MAG: translational GTPase TypA [Fusobacteriota bacterium]